MKQPCGSTGGERTCPADQQHYTTGISKPVEKISAVRTGTHPKSALNLIIREGDLLVIKSIDRLGRNYDETIRQWSLITKTIKADILVLDMPLLDTRKRGNDLTGTFVADLALQILSYVAQSERDAIRQRQAEGIAAAKERGVVFGRKPKELPEDFAEVCRARQAGELTMRAAAQRVSMSMATYCRRYHEQVGGALEKRKQVI